MNSLVRFLVSAAGTILAAAVVPAQDSVERFDTAYNSITLQRSGDIVELRARYRGNDTLESAVDLSDPLKLVVAYTRSLYGALFIEPNPKRVLMVGLEEPGFTGFSRPPIRIPSCTPSSWTRWSTSSAARG